MDEGATPPARAPLVDVPAEAPRAETSLARPPRLPRHTPARGATLAPGEAGDAITCTVPAAAAALVREALALALPGVPVRVVADHVAPPGDEAALAAGGPAWSALRRTRQLVAVSDVAMRLQHALANPLTALLFEAQLLEMEALPPALADAVGRIVTQCRRTIEVSRRLDAASAGAAASASPGASATSASASAAPFPRHDIRNPL